MRGWDDFGLTANFFEKKMNTEKNYIGDITQWREDTNFIFEWKNNILRKSAASE